MFLIIVSTVWGYAICFFTIGFVVVTGFIVWANKIQLFNNIRIEKNPVYISSVDFDKTMDSYKILYFTLINRREEWIALDNEKVVLTPVPLGMVNIIDEEESPVYYKRP